MNSEPANIPLKSQSIRDAFDAWEPDFQEDLLWAEINESLDIEQVWTKLDESLELEQVWNKLDISLNQVESTFSFSYRKAFSLTAIFVFVAFLWLKDDVSFVSVYSIDRVKKSENKEISTPNSKSESNPNLSHTTFVNRSKQSSVLIQEIDSIIPTSFLVSPPQHDRVVEQNEPVILVQSLSLKSIHPLDFGSSRDLISASKICQTNASKWNLTFYAGMNLSSIRVQNPRDLASFIPQVGSQMGGELTYQMEKNRFSILADIANIKMEETRFINGKFGSIYHQKYHITTGINYGRIILPNTELAVAGLISVPIQAISTREDILVGLPKTATEWGGQIGVTYHWTKQISTSIHYRFTQANKKPIDWNQTQQGLLNLRYTF